MADPARRTGPLAHEPDRILWDVVEEHLDEAEFLFGVCETAFASPHWTLREIARSPERRFWGHVDGLQVGGPTTAERLLLPVLADEAEPARVVAAACALLMLPERAWGQRLIDRLAELPPPHREAVVRAIGFCDRPDLDLRIGDALKRAEGEARAPLLFAAAMRGVDPSPTIDKWLRDDDPALRLAIAAALRHAPKTHGTWTDAALGADDPLLRRTAIATGLVHGSRYAWEAAGRLALDKTAPDREAMAWIVALGEPRLTDVIVGFLADEARRFDTLWALGSSGRLAAADACVRWLADEKAGPWAADAFATITGLPRDDRYWIDVPPDEDADVPPPLADDLEADLSVPPEENLRVPNPETIAAWWAETRPKLRSDARHLLGTPVDGAVLVRALREAPAWRRPTLALELLVRTHGAARVHTRMTTTAQTKQLDALAALPRLDGNRVFGQF